MDLADGNGQRQDRTPEARDAEAGARPVTPSPGGTLPPAPDGTLISSLRSQIPPWVRLPPLLQSLPAKLLMLTAAFVMMAEILLFVPTLATFRVNWLNERLVAAQLAALAAEGYPGGAVPSSIRADLLRTAQVKAVASRHDGVRRLVLPVDNDMKIDGHYDLRQSPEGFIQGLIHRGRLFGDTLGVLAASEGRTIRVLGRIGEDPNDLIEIVMAEAPLRAAMWEHTRMAFWLAALIALFTAGLVYLALNSLLVRPMMRMSRNMQAFSQNPEDGGRIITPSERTDEIGVAERELQSMQRQLSTLLAQKNRLAQLGLAVSKINHDLRNMLSSAQVISDRLTALPDPTVQRFAPKLISSLDRAINFCNDTLRFGKTDENQPRRDLMLLHPLVEEVGDGLGLPREGAIAWVLDFDPALRIDADPEHLFRIVGNLVRNAVQAIESQADSVGQAEPGRITVKAVRENRRVIVEVRDTGPGIPERARAHLFRAFQSSTRKGGSGLGLVISAELAAAHGGSLTLLDAPANPSKSPGAVFRLEIPDRHVS
jgi:signal transduction histidine kinase